MMICPFCEVELGEMDQAKGGWDCSCGEFIPRGLADDTDNHRQCECGGH